MHNNGKKSVLIAGRPGIQWDANLAVKILWSKRESTWHQWIVVKSISNTAIKSLTPAMVSSPSFIIRRFMVKRLGTSNDGRRWVYSSRRRNSGCSTSSKGWSQAAIHSIRRFSNFCWSQFSSYYILLVRDVLSTEYATYCSSFALFSKHLSNICSGLFKLEEIFGCSGRVKNLLCLCNCNLVLSRGLWRWARLKYKIKTVHSREVNTYVVDKP